MKRIVVETSDDKKSALETTLKKQGVSIAEWFNDQVEEIIEEPILFYDKRSNDLIELSKIQDSSGTLEILKGLDWSFSSDNTSYLSHNIHPYPAKYIPQIPNQLIRLLSLPGEKVWDPFGGSGTTALEALLLGRQAISTDINPITQIIGKAKCTTLTNDDENLIFSFGERMQLLSKSRVSFSEQFKTNETEILHESPIIPNQDKWFDNEVWKELGFIKWQINRLENATVKNFLLAILSKILIRVSYQDSETRYVSAPIKIETGFVLKLFSHEIKIILPKIKSLGTLLRFREATFITTDLRNESHQKDNSIDLIVTSPPYPNATDYHLYHRFRIFWMGYDPVEVGKAEIGSHLRHQKEKDGIEKYLEEMQMSLCNMLRALRPGRYAILVLGDAIFENIDYATAELVGERAQKIGFELVGIYKRDLHSTKRSFISPARRIKEEKFLVLRKKAEKLDLELKSPPYKLWPYENSIRRLEIENLLDVKVIHESSNSIQIKLDSMKTDLLKKLTFTHSFEGVHFAAEPTWQAIIENGEALENVSKRKDPKYATHGIHEYKGKFYPQLAKSLFNIAGLKAGNTVLDPFCGSGTVILEGYLNGFNAIGCDINPIALMIAKSKTEILKDDLYLTDRLLSAFIITMESIHPISYRNIFDNQIIAELEAWFPTQVLEKLASIIREIREVPNQTVKCFLKVCLSSIVREISQQDPLDLRIRRRKDTIIDAPVIELFVKKILEQRNRIRHFAKRSNQANSVFGSTNILELDSRTVKSGQQSILTKECIDCIVTSPPYATALPYIDTDRLSILLLFAMQSKDRRNIEDSLVGAREIAKTSKFNIENQIVLDHFEGILSETAKSIIKSTFTLNNAADVGFRKKNVASLLYRYYNDMSTIMWNLDWVVKKGGNLFFVIGDNRTIAGNENQEVLIKSSLALTEIGQQIGWELNKTIPITVTQENRLHNKNGILNNDILWFKKRL